MAELLRVEQLSKHFQVPAGTLHALDQVNLAIEEGETLGIVGESGCGKTTLGRVILRLHEPSEGRIYYDGMDLTRFTAEEMQRMRREMQIIFQDPYASLNPRMTISQIIREPLETHQICGSRQEMKNRVEALMEQVGLSRRAYNLYPHEFDGGRRQRVVIARALAVRPRFIVCDEPVSALDVSVQAQVLNLLRQLQREMKLTYIFISHDLSVVRHISKHIGVMYLGQMIEKAPRGEIFHRPLHPYTAALLSAIPSIDSRRRRQRVILKGEISSPINPAPGCRFGKRCPFAKERCLLADPPLEERTAGHEVACFRADEILAGSLSFLNAAQAEDECPIQA